MITNIYDEVGEIIEQDALEAALKRIGYIEMFEPIIKTFNPWLPFVLYVLHGYSLGSDYTSLGENWDSTKRRIADLVGIPKDVLHTINAGTELEEQVYLFDGVVELKFDEVNNVIHEYLNFQDDREFTHLMALRETYQLFIKSPYRKIDDDQMFKNMTNAKKLLEEIREFENTVQQKWGKAGLLDGKKEVEKAVSTKRRTSLSLEQRIG